MAVNKVNSVPKNKVRNDILDDYGSLIKSYHKQNYQYSALIKLYKELLNDYNALIADYETLGDKSAEKQKSFDTLKKREEERKIQFATIQYQGTQVRLENAENNKKKIRIVIEKLLEDSKGWITNKAIAKYLEDQNMHCGYEYRYLLQIVREIINKIKDEQKKKLAPKNI